MARRPRSRRSGLAGLVLFLLGVLVGAGGLYLACRDRSLARLSSSGAAVSSRPARSSSRARPASSSPIGRAGEEEATVPAATTGQAAPPPPEPVPVLPGEVHVALVIDDLGRSLPEIDDLERLGVPLTYAVLPFEEETPRVVAELRRRGSEVICHLPMEPKNGADPGPGALRLGMTRDELRTSTVAALAAVPGAVGVNNHMGSGLSADAGSMEAILKVLAARGLFFLDSRTSAESVGYRVATALGVPAAERQVFLDDDPRPEAVHAQFQRLLDLARQRGAAIAIGHPHPATLAALAAEVPRALSLGYQFVPVSYLMDKPGSPE
jgi:uncharacterized protein